MEKVYVAGGCFWCIGDYYLMQDGVEEVNVGFSGGDEKEATYQDVKSQKTGHRETIEIHFDPEVISLEKIIDLYYYYVDVLDEGGQEFDRGHSYTLALFYRNDREKELFNKKNQEVENKLNQKSAVSIEKFKFFILAEEEHQHYSHKNPEAFLKELEESGRDEHLALKKK